MFCQIYTYVPPPGPEFLLAVLFPSSSRISSSSHSLSLLRVLSLSFSSHLSFSLASAFLVPIVTFSARVPVLFINSILSMDAVHPSLENFGLHHAAAAGDDDGVRYALRSGADVNALDAAGKTALMCAIAGNEYVSSTPTTPICRLTILCFSTLRR